MNPEHARKSPPAKTGLFATLRGLLHARGSGAPSGRRPKLLLGAAAAVLAAIALLAALPAGAGAAATRVATGLSFGPEGAGSPAAFSQLVTIATDPATGSVYALNGSPGFGLYKFAANGEPANFSALGTNVIPGSYEGASTGVPFAQLAVAPVGSPGNTGGDIYVANGFSLLIFAANGEPLGELPQGSGGRILGVAVDPSGNLYVGEVGGTIRKFTPSANPVSVGDEAGATVAPLPLVINVAVDGVGHIYSVAPREAGVAEVLKLEQLSSPTFSTLDPSAFTVAVDPATNNVFAQRQGLVAEYDAAGSAAATFGVGELSGAGGVAAKPGSEEVYVGDAGAGRVKVFGPVVILPDAVSGEASAIGPTSATLTGTVSAAGGGGASCEFQYVDNTSFEASRFAAAQTVPCTPPGPFTGTESVQVSASVTGLAAESLYRYRVTASNEKGTANGATKPLFTSSSVAAAPAVSGEEAVLLANGGAELRGEVNPNRLPTSYQFEYVSESDFQASGYANATAVPVPAAALGSGASSIAVTEVLSSLAPLTTYHFHLIATNPLGETVGQDRTFTTSVVGTGLPDGRVYEQATPVEKEGNNVQGGFGTVQAAANGEAITFFAAGGFPGSPGAQDLPTFVGRRSPAGWSSAGLLPPAATGPRGKVRGWDEEITTAYSSNFRPAELPFRSLYRRNPDGTYAALTSQLTSESFFTGATPSGSVVAFEAESTLAPGAAEFGPNVYVYDAASAQLRLASILNSGEAPVEGAYGGPFNYWTGGGGGSSTTFYTGDEHVLSRGGDRLYFTDATTRQIYVRVNPTAAQSPLGSGEECLDPGLACTYEVSASQASSPDPNGPQAARFIGATPDGQSAFFMSRGALTDDATTGPADEGSDLYRYDVATEELTDLIPDAADPNGAEVLGVVGFSEDASRVYFVANSVLAAGAAPGTCTRVGATENAIAVEGACNLYEWNRGTVNYVDRLRSEGSEVGSAARNWAPMAAESPNLVDAGRVSANGEAILYSQFELVPPAEGEQFAHVRAELFRYSAASGQTSCVSCDPSGAIAKPNASLSGVKPFFIGPIEKAQTLTRNVSGDGSRVFFDTPDRLLPQDQNGVNDAYEWEADGSGSCQSQAQNGGCLYLLSSGTSPQPSYFADADREGNNAFFFTAQPLVAQDKDQLIDIYDARVGGGIAAQNAQPGPPCGGEEQCRGPAAQPPSLPAGTTAASGSEGNVKHHHKKKHKHHHKKKHGHHHKKGKRAGKGTGR